MLEIAEPLRTERLLLLRVRGGGAHPDLAFDEVGLQRVIGRADANNAGSAALMRRLGMRQEAHFVQNEIFKGEWGDEVVFAILADEWRARRQRRASQGSASQGSASQGRERSNQRTSQ